MNSISDWHACYLHPVCCVDFVWTKCQTDCQQSKKSNVKGKRLDVILSSSGATSAPRVVTWSFGMSEAVECVKPGWAKPNKQSKWKNQMLTSCNPCRPINSKIAYRYFLSRDLSDLWMEWIQPQRGQGQKKNIFSLSLVTAFHLLWVKNGELVIDLMEKGWKCWGLRQLQWNYRHYRWRKIVAEIRIFSYASSSTLHPRQRASERVSEW